MTAGRFTALVVAAIVILEALWIAVLPPFRGSDEFDHAFRAAAVARGEWHAGRWVAFGRGRLVTVPEDVADAANAQCASLAYTGRDNCLPVERASDGMVRIASGAGSYQPWYYWVIGTAAQPFEGAGALYAMRIAGGFLCTCMVALAAWCWARCRRSVWSRVAFVLGLTPVAIYTMIVAAPNGLEIASALAVWCSLFALQRTGSARGDAVAWGVLVVSSVLLAGLRELGAPFLAVIVACCVLAEPARALAVAQRDRWRIVVLAVLVGLVVLAEHWWASQDRASVGSPLTSDGWTPMRPAFLVLWLLQTIAAFPFRDQPAHPAVYLLVAGTFAYLLAAALRHGTRYTRIVLSVVLVGAFAMPLVLTLATYDSRGVIWQGRYGLPVFVGIGLIAAGALEDWEPVRSRMRVAAITASLAVAHLVSIAGVLKLERSRDTSTSDPAWHPPGELLVVVGAAMAFALVLLALDRPRERTLSR